MCVKHLRLDGRAEFASRFISTGYWFFERGSWGVFLWAQYTALGEGEVEGAALTIWLRWLAFGSYFLDGLAHGVEGVAAQARKALDASLSNVGSSTLW